MDTVTTLGRACSTSVRSERFQEIRTLDQRKNWAVNGMMNGTQGDSMQLRLNGIKGLGRTALLLTMTFGLVAVMQVSQPCAFAQSAA